MTERERKIRLAQTLWAGFYRCPNSQRILEQLLGDDKVMCSCGRSNPKVPEERTPQTGTHIVRFLEPVGAEEYVDARMKLNEVPR